MQWLIDLLLHRGNDLSTFFLPNAYFFKKSILEFGQIPLWNPIQFTGLPYLADPQNFIFYLPDYLLVLLPVEPAFIILLFGHLLLAGFGTYILAKNHFKLSKPAAIFAALAFVLTPKMFSHLEAGHYTMIIAFSWLPWFLLAAFKFVEKPTIRKTIRLSLLSFLLYINYINIAYFSLLFLAAFTVFRAFKSKKQLNIKKYLTLNAFYLLLFLGLISPVLLPQLEFAPLSTRNLLTFQDVAQPIWSLKLFFQNLFFPFLLDHGQLSTERVLFPGVIIWLLALVGLFRRKERDKYFFAGWIAFSLLFALGARIPFFVLFYKRFPLMRWMRVTTRLWIISLVIIVIFAGLGFQQLLKRKKLFPLPFILLFLGLVEILFINQKIFSRPVHKNQLPLSFYKVLKNDPEKNFRVYCTTGCFSLEKLGELDIDSATGNNPVQIQSFVDFLQSAGGYTYQKFIPILPPYATFSQKPQPDAKLLSRLNVKYVASSYQLKDEAFELIKSEAGYFLYGNPQSQFAWLSTGGRVGDYQKTPNKFTLGVSNSDGRLVSSEMFYPGWKAFDQQGNKLQVLDMKPFLGADINESTTAVTFKYCPTSLKISLVLFAISWVGIIYASGYPQFLLRPS